MTVNILKTTAQNGLTVQNINIHDIVLGNPILTANGDSIYLKNVTAQGMSNKRLSFEYTQGSLIEGNGNPNNKYFSGEISFYSVSDLSNTIEPSPKKIKADNTCSWTWTIRNSSAKNAENVHAKMSLPTGLAIKPDSIRINGNPAIINDLNDVDLGDIDTGDRVVITFVTTVTGNAEEWLEVTGRLDWEDDTITSPYFNEEKAAVQILDDEQTYTPKKSENLALLSTPIFLNYGVQSIGSTAKTYQLHSANYQTNTNVVTKGFYTRVKDDRPTSTGWKLSASLSDFKDAANNVMPNSSGTQLKFEDLTIECITDRDTPQEAIDPSPTGVPSSVQTTETLMVGQTGKTLISAQSGEGQGTWQLRMPFDKISLSLPANAGKKSTNYRAKLTWSLDDTP